jgi:hypothetical protein
LPRWRPGYLVRDRQLRSRFSLAVDKHFAERGDPPPAAGRGDSVDNRCGRPSQASGASNTRFHQFAANRGGATVCVGRQWLSAVLRFR